MALFVCAHVAVMFDWEGNKQELLQGHVRYIIFYSLSLLSFYLDLRVHTL